MKPRLERNKVGRKLLNNNFKAISNCIKSVIISVVSYITSFLKKKKVADKTIEQKRSQNGYLRKTSYDFFQGAIRMIDERSVFCPLENLKQILKSLQENHKHLASLSEDCGR